MIQINVCQWFAPACASACYIYFVNTFVVRFPLIDTSGRQRWRWRWRRQMAMAMVAVISNKMIDWHSSDGTFIRRWFQGIQNQMRMATRTECQTQHLQFIYSSCQKWKKAVNKYVHSLDFDGALDLFGIFSNIKIKSEKCGTNCNARIQGDAWKLWKSRNFFFQDNQKVLGTAWSFQCWKLSHLISNLSDFESSKEEILESNSERHSPERISLASQLPFPSN